MEDSPFAGIKNDLLQVDNTELSFTGNKFTLSPANV
jgi:hypothetical protein